jgi:uncharacterized RDD family membrane protein YckC
LAERTLDGNTGHRLASLGSRFIAQILDSMLGFVPLLAFVGLAFVLELDDIIKGWMVILGCAFIVVYLLFQDGMGRGQSWGKRMQSIAVVDQRTGEPCGYRQSLARNASMILLNVIDCIFIFGRSRQRLGDMLAKTVVVYVERK